MTSNGRVRLRRVRWQAAEGGAQTPVERLLDRAEKTFSRGVREMLCRLNQCSSSFDATAENIGRLTPIEISGESVRRLVEAEGRAAASAMRRGRLDPGWSSADCRTEQGTTRVYVGCDGVKVPLVTDAEKRKRRAAVKQKRRRCGKKLNPLPAVRPGADQSFKEFRIVTAYDQSQKRRTVAVTGGDHEAAGRLMRSMAVQLKLDRADESIANVDGAPWIRNQLQLHGITDHIGLDYYHLQDYAQRTRREVYGEDSDQGRAWLDALMQTFLGQPVEAAWEQLVQWRSGLRARRRRAADRLLGYVAERREMIQYAAFRQKGWQIGSGPTEAQCKTTTLRLKGRGRRWDRPAAEALMALAALHASGQWNNWWLTPENQAA